MHKGSGTGISAGKYYMKLNKALLPGVLALMVLAGTAFGQGSIEGSVTNANEESLPNVTVTVTDGNAKTIATAKTDQDGAYSLDGIAAGTYTVSAAANGFESASKKGVSVEDDDTVTVDLQLTPAKAVSAPPPVKEPEERPHEGEQMTIWNRTGSDVRVFLFIGYGSHPNENGGKELSRIRNGDRGNADVPNCQFTILLLSGDDIWQRGIHDCRNTELTFDSNTGHSKRK